MHIFIFLHSEKCSISIFARSGLLATHHTLLFVYCFFFFFSFHNPDGLDGNTIHPLIYHFCMNDLSALAGSAVLMVTAVLGLHRSCYIKGRKKLIKHSSSNVRYTWVEVNGSSHANTLKLSQGRTFHSQKCVLKQHADADIYILNVQPWILMVKFWKTAQITCQRLLLCQKTHHNCRFKSRSLWACFYGWAVRSSLASVSRRWWKMGSTGRDRCKSDETPAGLWTDTSRFSPSPSYAEQAEGKGTEREEMKYMKQLRETNRELNFCIDFVSLRNVFSEKL